MPRLTPQQLRAAKKKAEEKRQMEAKRQASKAEQLKLDKARTEQIMSVAGAIYDELDKLNKKAPGMIVSELTLERVNKVIRASKELMKQDADEFVDDIVEFVPAGDMPEYRDVVLVIGQVRAGLDRFKKTHIREWPLSY